MAASVDREVRDGHVCRAEERKFLSDLTGFPNLAATLAFEETWKKKNRKKKNKKRHIDCEAQNDTEQHHQKPEQMPVTEGPKLEQLVILSDDSDSELVMKNSHICEIHSEDTDTTQWIEVKKKPEKERGDKVVVGLGSADLNNKVVSNGHISKADEYKKVLTDLIDFPNLASMLPFEASSSSRRRRRRRNRKKKSQIEIQAQNYTEQHNQKPEQTAATEEPQLQELVILSDNNDNGGMKNGNGKVTTELRERKNQRKSSRDEEERGDNIVQSADHKVSNGHVSKADEYKMLADLSDFPTLAAMLAFEATWRNNRKKKKKKKRKIEYQVQNVRGQHHREPEQMAATEEPQLQELVILPDNNDNGGIKNGQTYKINGKVTTELREGNNQRKSSRDEEERGHNIFQSADHKVRNGHISKVDEYKMLADLSDFPNLAAMLAFEASWRNNRKKKNKKRKIEYQVQNVRGQHHQKPEQMAATEEPQLQELLILPENNDKGGMKNGQSCKINGKVTTELKERKKQRKISEGKEERGDNVVQSADYKVSNGHISKADEYKMLADLSDFPNLAAMLAFESTWRNNRKKKKKKKKKKRNKRKIEFQEQNVRADAAEEETKTRTCKAVEATKALKSADSVRYSVIVNICSSSPEGEDETADLGSSKALREMVPAETTGKRKENRIEAQDDTVNAVEEDKQADSSKERMPFQTETVRIMDDIVPRKLLVNAVEEDKWADSNKERMPFQTKTVRIMDDIVPRKLLRRPRYFDHPICSMGMAEDDHTAVNHTGKKRKKMCFLCGDFKHNAKHCKQVIDCFVCCGRGHLANDCPEKHVVKAESSKKCLRCGDSGHHDMFSCSSDYSPDDLKEIQCCVCQDFGHLCCVDHMGEDPRQVSCCKCGQSGHLDSDCTKLLGITTGLQSAFLCYNCGEKGHFARECMKCTKFPHTLGDLATTQMFLKNSKDLLESELQPSKFDPPQGKSE